MKHAIVNEEMTSEVPANKGSASVAGLGNDVRDPPVKSKKKLRDILRKRMPNEPAER